MKARYVISATTALATLCLFALAFAAPEVDTLINIAAFPELERPVVPFSSDVHDMHMEVVEDCTTCHHVYEDGKLVEGETSEGIPCSDCHSLEATDDNPMPLRRAYHVNCATCHEEEAAGPVMCGECHARPAEASTGH